MAFYEVKEPISGFYDGIFIAQETTQFSMPAAETSGEKVSVTHCLPVVILQYCIKTYAFS